MKIILKKCDGGYQTEPLYTTGIGRFQVRRTDNASARNTGRLPRWTVQDLYRNVTKRGEGYERFDTLAEVKEWISRRLDWSIRTKPLTGSPTMYEITFVDSGKSVTWSESKCRKTFGPEEWKEIKAGYAPHIIVVKID